MKLWFRMFRGRFTLIWDHFGGVYCILLLGGRDFFSLTQASDHWAYHMTSPDHGNDHSPDFQGRCRPVSW